ncbi:MAG: hypothetical protein M3Y82_11630 [Verrucomicrobiota bacterium]|nr:hypothetical protein [Verrucomicrobiota bacterium]
MTEQELLKDCLRRLNAAEVAYMVTGSMASNYWGIPRTTHDLDFVIQLPPSAIPALVTAFSGEFFIQEESIRAAYRPPHQFNAIDTRSELKVDFWLLKNIPFEREMFSRRRKITVFGETAWMATAEDVILHKLYWNQITPSERQLKDSAGVFAIQREMLDLNYLHHWAKEMDVSETLEQLLAGKIRPKTT